MCNCGITPKIGYGMMMAISILTILLSIACIQGALYGFFNPVLYYAYMNVSVMIQGFIMFALLLAGGILGICGLKRKKFVCIFIMFFFLLAVQGMAMRIAWNMQGVYMALITNDETSTDRYLVAQDIEKVSALATTNLCTATCPCNLTETTFSTFIASATGSNGISATGKTKFQDCAAPAWYSEYQRPAAMMAALQQYWHCTGWSSSSSIYYFTDVNTVIPISGNACGAHYDTLVSGATFIVGGQFFSISVSAFFLWVWMAIVGMNHGLRPEGLRDQVSGVGFKGQD